MYISLERRIFALTKFQVIMNVKNNFRVLSFIVAIIVGLVGYAQQGIKLDASFIPGLKPQTTSIRSVMPLYDGRVALIEFWQDANNYFQNELGCLQSNGERDQTYSSLSGALGLYPWNDESFFSWQNHFGTRINRHHTQNGEVDTNYHYAPTGQFELYDIHWIYDVIGDSQGRIYLAGDITLTDTSHGLIGHRDFIRLNQDGGLDSSFIPAISPELYRALPLPSGQVAIAGWQTAYNGTSVANFFIVNGDGSIDNDFQTNFLEAAPTSVLPTPDGGMIFTGRFIDFVSLVELDTMFVVKLFSDGSRDPSFNSDLRPYQQLYSGLYTKMNSIVPWGQSNYLISGNFDIVDGQPRRGIAMVDANGFLDPTACVWPGPGLTEDARVYISLVADGNDGVFAYGNFIGFDDGNQTSTAKGLVHFVHGDVGIVENGTSISWVHVYPTPASSFAWLEWDSADPVESALLCDGLGRAVRRIPIAPMNNKTMIQLFGLPGGTYLIRATHRSGTVSSIQTIIMG